MLKKRSVFVPIAGILGASAVGAGAVGAHGLRDKTPQMKEIFKTGANYHLLHSVILASAALALPAGRKKNIVCSLFTSGIVLFSGSCYTCAFMDERKPYSYPAPVGGFAGAAKVDIYTKSTKRHRGPGVFRHGPGMIAEQLAAGARQRSGWTIPPLSG